MFKSLKNKNENLPEKLVMPTAEEMANFLLPTEKTITTVETELIRSGKRVRGVLKHFSNSGNFKPYKMKNSPFIAKASYEAVLSEDELENIKTYFEYLLYVVSIERAPCEESSDDDEHESMSNKRSLYIIKLEVPKPVEDYHQIT